MDISVPSRFACLKIEDDEFRTVTNKPRKKFDNKQTKKVVTSSQNNITGKKTGNSVPKQPKKDEKQSSKKARAKSKLENKQWEEWKRKDDEMVDDNFEQDLQCAILQSKLDFEQQKKKSTVKIEPEQNQGKKKKNKTMSLDQFLENGNENKQKEEDGKKHDQDEGNFFEKTMESVKHEITREKVEEGRRKRQENLEEVISLAQCQEKLEKERIKNAKLQKELEEVRKEVASVKKRNTTLCNMLSQGEMKDKSEVLLELERLNSVKQELTEEVEKLHKLLEQERSSKANGAIEGHQKQKNKK